jgi:leader peptidase (prepilin peptidase)/N-methyltransferase
MVPLIVAAALVGLIVGSFLNVVAFRVPRHMSIVKPRSRCPGCQVEIAPRDNIPVASWLLLRGRCRHCGERISVRYPLIEIATGVLFVGAAARFGPTVETAAFAVLFATLIAISVIDLEFRLVPKVIVWPVAAGGVLLLAAASIAKSDPTRMLQAGLGAAIAFGVLFVIHLISPRGMGFGDVRLALLLGLFLGWISIAHVGLGLFAAFVFGGVGGVIALAAGRSRRSALPFAPFLAAGTVVAILWGQPILDWYLPGG